MRQGWSRVAKTDWKGARHDSTGSLVYYYSGSWVVRIPCAAAYKVVMRAEPGRSLFPPDSALETAAGMIATFAARRL